MSNAALPRSCPIGRENPERGSPVQSAEGSWYLKAWARCAEGCRARRAWHQILKSIHRIDFAAGGGRI